MRTWMLGWDWDAGDSLSVTGLALPGVCIPLLPRDGLLETETTPCFLSIINSVLL